MTKIDLKRIEKVSAALTKVGLATPQQAAMIARVAVAALKGVK